MSRVTGLAVNPFKGIRSRIRLGDVTWSRMVVLAELLAFLAFAIALTIAPQITLGFVAALATRVNNLAIDSRPVVAAFGLLLVGLAVLGLRAVTQARQSESPTAQPLEFRAAGSSAAHGAHDAA